MIITPEYIKDIQLRNDRVLQGLKRCNQQLRQMIAESRERTNRIIGELDGSTNDKQLDLFGEGVSDE